MGGGEGKSGEGMKEVWDEAHRMFKEKMKGREAQKTEVHLQPGDDDGTKAFPSLS
jgi:hypothetical protein